MPNFRELDQTLDVAECLRSDELFGNLSQMERYVCYYLSDSDVGNRWFFIMASWNSSDWTMSSSNAISGLELFVIKYMGNPAE